MKRLFAALFLVGALSGGLALSAPSAALADGAVTPHVQSAQSAQGVTTVAWYDRWGNWHPNHYYWHHRHWYHHHHYYYY